ncbi:MAG: CHAT domain-containing protein [Thermoflexibacter sp.]|jgi:hypothetical protein|nr:CHAT domain-containing protein [Thermoflexibacter sp.]
MPKPVIFLAFANDRQDNARYLRNIPAEYNAIEEVLNQAQKKGLCEYKMLPYATFSKINAVFTDEAYRNRIAIFHFSGHADGFQLLLENEEGKPKEAYGKGLVDYFSILKTQNIQKNLQLLFFNGCCTAQLGEDLKSVIPATIGTVDSVNDAQAKAIAVSFYEHLTKNIALMTAFDLAKAERSIEKDTLRGLYRKDLNEIPHSEPWQLYLNPAHKEVINWQLGAVGVDKFAEKRKGDLLKRLDMNGKLLYDYELKKDLADDPKIIMRCEMEIEKINLSIEKINNELHNLN